MAHARGCGWGWGSVHVASSLGMSATRGLARAFACCLRASCARWLRARVTTARGALSGGTLVVTESIMGCWGMPGPASRRSRCQECRSSSGHSLGVHRGGPGYTPLGCWPDWSQPAPTSTWSCLVRLRSWSPRYRVPVTHRVSYARPLLRGLGGGVPLHRPAAGRPGRAPSHARAQPPPAFF